MKYITLISLPFWVMLIPWANANAQPCSPAYFAYPNTTVCLSTGTLLVDSVSTSNALFYALSPGITISGWGTIDLANSNPGTYVIAFVVLDSCQNLYTASITLIAASNAEFSYSDSVFCKPGLPELPIIAGDSGGTFSATSGLAIGSTNGQINVATSAMGNFTVQYTLSGTCPDTASFMLDIQGQKDASFLYPDSIFCENGSDPQAVIMADSAGKFGVGTGLDLDSLTGHIDLSASSPGYYSVQYQIEGTCGDTASFALQIAPSYSAFFQYPPGFICKNQGLNPIPTTANPGIFSEPTGFLQFADTLSGEIDLAATPQGYYLVLHTTPGQCPDSSTGLVYILPQDDADFHYPDTIYCQGQSYAAPVMLGQGGGTFWTNSPGIALDSSTGFIDLPNSQISWPKINYTTPGPCPDTASFWMIIAPQGKADFSYIPTSWCLAGSNPLPIVTGDTNGTFSCIYGGAMVNPITGETDLSQSQPGDSILIKYHVPGLTAYCPDSQVIRLKFYAPDTSISVTYPKTNYCITESNPAPVVNGDPGGIFQSIPLGMSFVSFQTGVIDIAASQPGTYQIQYLPPGTCADSSGAFVLTIHPAPSLNLNYPIASTCQGSGMINPVNLADSNGQFTLASGNGLVLNSISGQINSDSSYAGIYTIHYQSGGACPLDTTFDFTIHALPDPTLLSNADSNTICDGEAIELLALGGDKYEFYYQDSLVRALSANPAFYPSFPIQNGDEFKIKALNLDGNCTALDSLEMAVINIPQILDLDYPDIAQSGTPFEIEVSLDRAGLDLEITREFGIELLATASKSELVSAPSQTHIQLETLSLRDPKHLAQVQMFFRPMAGACMGEADSLEITLIPSQPRIFIPGIITPNGDGRNDVWEIRFPDSINPEFYQISVHNRDGGRVYQQENLNPGWTGSGLPDGVYWYVITSRSSNSNPSLSRQGGSEPIAKGGLTIRRK